MIERGLRMKKVKMHPFSGMTFEEGCEKHFLYPQCKSIPNGVF
jgi:hypothetical protein